ncbi:MAG: hypothetical protein ACR2IE_11595 [Candidatus Sumerlaeaceae bacterium]
MARIYEFPNAVETDLEGSRPSAFDPVTRRALGRFWISALGIIVAALALYGFSRQIVMPGWTLAGAITAAIVALLLLFVMNRALRKIKVVSAAEAKLDKRTEQMLAQLDDRFSVFNQVMAGEHRVDHVIVGPSGIYSVKASATLDQDGWARSADIDQALVEREAVSALVKHTLPEASVQVEPVLCVPAGSTVRVGQEDKGVWVVPAEKLAAALIKRSSQEGAIGKNVNETGAFSSDALQAAAIERALANHWNIPTRKTQADYTPPSELT